MATAREVVTDALKLLQIYSAGEAPSSEDMADGITVLNDMLFSWAIDGINLNHETVVEADTLPVPDDHLWGIKNNLAVEFAGQFNKDVPARVAFNAENTKSLLRALYLDTDPLRIDRALQQRRRWGLASLTGL